MRIFPPLKRRDLLLLIGIGLAYFMLNLTHLTRLPIFVDEALYLRWAQIAWHDATWRFISLTDGKQPLYIWFVIPFMKFISDPLYAGRLASVVAGFFTLLGSFYAGWIIRDKRLGFTAALLTLFSPYLFFYNRFGVMESLLAAGGIWSFNLSVLLARYRRLDLAMILGFALGFSLLIKSSALFYFLFAPVAYFLVVTRKTLFSRQTVKYLGLIATSWVIAQLINNVQRLSPWMHMIGEKNSFFTVAYGEIFQDFGRLSNNTLDIFRWHFAYTTVPVALLAFLGIYLMARKNWRLFLVLIIWTAGQLGGTAAIARLYAPRYIAFVTPFILLFASYALVSFRRVKISLALTSLILVMPIILILKLLTDPISFPYTSVDEGYVNGWSAGQGTKEIADWAITRIETIGPGVTIYTEGTFGILPHGLELYVDGKAPGLVIQGVYPINEIPPNRTIEQARQNPETYLVLNNTDTDSIPDGLELIAEYPKRDPAHSMRLYRVLPQP